MDLNKTLDSYAQETERLELAYAYLQKQFHELKENVHASHRMLEQIIAHMTDGLIFINKQGLISVFNPAAAEILGCATQSVLHKEYWDCFPDTLFGFSMHEALQKITPEHSSTPVYRRIFLNISNKQEVEISTSSVPNSGLLILIYSCIEQKKLETGLSQCERLKELGEMAATLAHEIRNPLGGIEGFAQLLRRDLKDPAQQNMVSAILDGTRSLNKLVTEVLDYARPLQLHFEPVDLFILTQETLNFFSSFKNAPRCYFQPSQLNCLISIDREHIKCVLLNILRNAYEAQSTLITVESFDTTLSIKDNGIGISQTDLRKIFTPFFTTKTRGTGLGLAHSLAVMKAHGGSLEVSSQIGKGTQFMLKFI